MELDPSSFPYVEEFDGTVDDLKQMAMAIGQRGGSSAAHLKDLVQDHQRRLARFAMVCSKHPSPGVAR